MIFHEKYQNDELNHFIEDACKISFFFSHLVYWSLNSLRNTIIESESLEPMYFLFLFVLNFFILSRINSTLMLITESSCKNKKNHAFIAYSELLKNLKRNTNLCEEIKLKLKEIIKEYGTSSEKTIKNYSNNLIIKANDINLIVYKSIFKGKKENG